MAGGNTGLYDLRPVFPRNPMANGGYGRLQRFGGPFLWVFL